MATDPVPPSIASYVHSTQIAQSYDHYFANTALFAYDTTLLDELLPQPCRLIDLGCGTGRHTVHFAAKGFDVTGVDLSQYMLIQTAAKCHERGVRADLHQLNLCDLSTFPDGGFDAAICMFSTLGMIRGGANRRTLLREVRRILRPGGRFIFHVHNRWHNLTVPDGRRWLLYTYSVGWLTGEVGDKSMENYRGIPGMYLHVFSQGELERLVSAARMTVERIVYLNEERDGELPPCSWRSVRANGFIVVCAKA